MTSAVLREKPTVGSLCFRRVAVGALALAGACLLGPSVAVAETNAYYVPQSGTSPYDWSIVGNWFRDTAGTTAMDALPGTNDQFLWNYSALNGKEIVIPTGTAASIHTLELGTESVLGKLTIGDGASLKWGHTSYVGKKGSSNELHVASGGTLTTSSSTIVGFMGTGTSGLYYGSHILVDEGGTYNQKGNLLVIGEGYKGDAFVENHGKMYLDSWLIGGGFGDSGQFYTNKAASASTYIKGYFRNYGTLTTSDHSSTLILLGGCDNGYGYFYNEAGASASLMLPLYVGSAFTNSYGYVYNSGELTSTRQIYIGGRGPTDNSTLTSNSKYPRGYFYNQKGGNLTLKGELRMGVVRYGRGTLELATGSAATLSGAVKIGYAKYSQGSVNIHNNSVLTNSGEFVLGNLGYGKMLVHGHFVPTGNTPFKIGTNSHTWENNKGELEISSNGRYYGNRSGFEIATAANGTEGHVLLTNTAKIEKPGTINMATGTTSVATFTIAGNGILQTAGAIRVGVGSATTAVTTQSAKLVMSNDAWIASLAGSLYIASGTYSRGEVVVADNAKISYSSPASLNIANSSPTAEGQLRLRGGTIVMATNSNIRVGCTAAKERVCNGLLSGWGRFDRLEPTLDSGKGDVNIMIYGGAITADGEGEARDLDLSVIRKVNLDDSLGDNNSGTNGWYAINKGRLTYPCRNGACVNLGEYYSRDEVKFVNAVHFDFVGKSGYLIGQLYATDRDDIPAGLPVDNPAEKTLRLGVWRATVNNDYKNATNVTAATRGTVSSAAVTVRYNDFLLNALKDGAGALGDDLRLTVYWHSGAAAGAWRRVKSVGAVEAETADHLVTATLPSSSEAWNLGFFAVVAEPRKGTTIILR